MKMKIAMVRGISRGCVCARKPGDEVAPIRSSWPQCWPQNAKPQKGAKCRSGKALHVIVNKFDCNRLEMGKSGLGKAVGRSGVGLGMSRGMGVHKMDLAVGLLFRFSTRFSFLLIFLCLLFCMCAYYAYAACATETSQLTKRVLKSETPHPTAT